MKVKLQSFFAAVNEVAANPASLPSRQSLLSSAQTLAARFGEIDSRFGEIAEGVINQDNIDEMGSFASHSDDDADEYALPPA